jgi:hypothetical protein
LTWPSTLATGVSLLVDALPIPLAHV